MIFEIIGLILLIVGITNITHLMNHELRINKLEKELLKEQLKNNKK